MKQLKPTIIENYYYNYKVKLFNKKISSFNSIERNYLTILKDNLEEIIDVENKVFFSKICLLSNKKKKIIKFLNKLKLIIDNSSFCYDVELNYYYFKSKRKHNSFSHSNSYYELILSCYDSRKKIGQEINYKFKKFKIKKLFNKIKEIENILNQNVDNKIESIETDNLVISSFAFSQMLSLYKKIIWENRKIINKKISIISVPKGLFSYNSIFYNKKGKLLRIKNFLKTKKYSEVSVCKSFIFLDTHKVKNINEELKTGYIITKMYFLNNPKEHIDTIKVLCSGYYIQNGIPISIFSNKLYSFRIIELLNNIKFTSRKKEFSNDFICPDIYIDTKKNKLS